MFNNANFISDFSAFPTRLRIRGFDDLRPLRCNGRIWDLYVRMRAVVLQSLRRQNFCPIRETAVYAPHSEFSK